MKTSSVVLTLKRVCQGLIKFLLNGSELRVWQISDGYGQTSWRTYDPATGHSTYLGSESEVRSWIEQRYYNR